MSSGWRYMAQRVDGTGSWGQFLDFDLPLDGVNCDEILSGHNSLTASITPEQTRLKGADGRPLFEEWGTAIWAETPAGDIYGGILTHSTFEGPNWSIECSDLSATMIDMPFTDATHFENVDPLDLFRHIWGWAQAQRGGNLGVSIDATASPIRLGTTYIQKQDFDLEPDITQPNTDIVDDPEEAPAPAAPSPWKNNAEWREAAAKAVHKNGGWKLTKADAALGVWLNGDGKMNSLTDEQKKIVKAGIKHKGMPPNPPGGSASYTPTINVQPGATTPSQFANNAQWKARGVKEMVKANYKKEKVEAAIDVYLASLSAITDEQSKIVKRVIQKIGKPPQPPIGPGYPPPSTSTGDPDPDPDPDPTLDPQPEYEILPYKLNWYTNLDLDSDLNNLAAETPFDWHMVHFWNGDELRHHIRLGYPRLGRRIDDGTLRFVIGENIDEVPSVERDGMEYANEILVLGAGEGAAMIRGRAFRAGDGRIRRIATITAPDITTEAAANALAEVELAKRYRLDDITTLVLRDHPHAPMGSVALGDEILVEGETGWADIEMWVRVIGRGLSPDSGEAMTLTVIRSDRIG